MDETFMGIGIWSDEPVVLPDDVGDHNLGQSIIAELDAHRVGLPSPTRAGWSAWNKAQAAQLHVRSIAAFLRESRLVSVVRGADELTLTPADTTNSPEWGLIDDDAVRLSELDATAVGKLVRELQARARYRPEGPRRRGTPSGSAYPRNER
jgi:hypothetical protein